MPAIAMALIWSGYTLMFWGYTKVQAYNISLSEIVIPGRYKGTWPPPGDDVLHRDGSGSGGGSISGSIGTIPGRGTSSSSQGGGQPPTLI